MGIGLAWFCSCHERDTRGASQSTSCESFGKVIRVRWTDGRRGVSNESRESSV